LYNIKTIVLGLSQKSDGSLGEIGELSEAFGQYIKENYADIEVEYYDESLSTKQVEQYFREMGMPLKKYKKEIDKYAAEVILQRYLNFRGEK
jgi:putative Holliday junction resolvase